MLYLAKISGERLQDHWSSVCLFFSSLKTYIEAFLYMYQICLRAKRMYTFQNQGLLYKSGLSGGWVFTCVCKPDYNNCQYDYLIFGFLFQLFSVYKIEISYYACAYICRL